MGLPSSEEHCPVCPFDLIEPSLGAAIHESALVQIHVRDLAIDQTSGVSENMRKQGLPAERVMAALGCAACIFDLSCPNYRYVKDVIGTSVRVVQKQPNRD